MAVTFGDLAPLTSILRSLNKKISDTYDMNTRDFPEDFNPERDIQGYAMFGKQERELVDLLWQVLEPHVDQWFEQADPRDRDIDWYEKMADRLTRVARHKHECGQRTTSGPVVVESA